MFKEPKSEDFKKLYQKLRLELEEAFSSSETGDNIWNICEKNEIDEVTKVAKLVGNVLLGILPVEEFQETLEKELNLEKDIAKKVAQEINRFIFYPVKPALEQLYKMGANPAEETIIKSVAEKPITEKQEETKTTEQKLETPATKDSYRETIE